VTRYYRSTTDVVCSPAMLDGEALGLIGLGYRKSEVTKAKVDEAAF
jgi:hypothetical protein